MPELSSVARVLCTERRSARRIRNKRLNSTLLVVYLSYQRESPLYVAVYAAWKISSPHFGNCCFVTHCCFLVRYSTNGEKPRRASEECSSKFSREASFGLKAVKEKWPKRPSADALRGNRSLTRCSTGVGVRYGSEQLLSLSFSQLFFFALPLRFRLFTCVRQLLVRPKDVSTTTTNSRPVGFLLRGQTLRQLPKMPIMPWVRKM